MYFWIGITSRQIEISGYFKMSNTKKTKQKKRTRMSTLNSIPCVISTLILIYHEYTCINRGMDVYPPC